MVLAQASTRDADSDPSARVAIRGPQPPTPPQVAARDAAGLVTLRATRLAEPIVVDGQLDDPSYQEIPSVGGFVQQEPSEG